MALVRPESSNSETQRVFVALWPPAETRRRLELLADQLHARVPRARKMRGERLHLTLAFIGALETSRAIDLAFRLASHAGHAFDWTLDHIGHFARARVVWAGGSALGELQALVGDVRALLEAMGIAYDRKPFVPHVTLLREVSVWPSRTAPLAEPILWRCERPTLVRSEGGRYVNVLPTV